MRYRRIGDSDLLVSEIALGTNFFGDAIEGATAAACLNRALDLGINFIDTANVYGLGAAETFLGDELSRLPRNSFLIATKVYFPMDSENRGLSAEQVRKQCEGSLRRLRVDSIDLYQCHRFDTEVPLEETMGALARLVAEGKVRYLGFSEWSIDQIRAALALTDIARFVASQSQYSLLHREPEQGIFDVCAAAGIGQLAWAPLAEGVLTGKYPPDAPPPPDARVTSRAMGHTIGRYLTTGNLGAVAALKSIAAELSVSSAQLALAWVLREPRVACAITGASSSSQIEENCAASGIELDVKMLRRIDELFPLKSQGGC